MKSKLQESQSIAKKVIRSIRGHGRGWVFSPASFKGLGSCSAVESALRRHKDEGTIRRLARGLYDYPRTDPGVYEGHSLRAELDRPGHPFQIVY